MGPVIVFEFKVVTSAEYVHVGMRFLRLQRDTAGSHPFTSVEHCIVNCKLFHLLKKSCSYRISRVLPHQVAFLYDLIGLLSS
jgi:hypothetical protein